MFLREIGGILLLLIAVLLFGHLWFHLVEAVLNRIKGLFRRSQEPVAWHPLSPEEGDKREA